MNEDIRELIAEEQGVDLVDHGLDDFTEEDAIAYEKQLAELKEWPVKLTYFRPTGKYYTAWQYTTKKLWMWEVSDEVKKMRDAAKLPGIGGKAWIIHVEPAENHPNAYPLLILPKEENENE